MGNQGLIGSDSLAVMEEIAGALGPAWRESLPISFDQQNELIVWFVRTLLDILQAKNFVHRVANTTLTFFRRFFLRRSLLAFPPQSVLFVCMILAIKAENLSDYTTAAQLFGDVGPSFDLKQVLELEVVVLSVLDFELLILHGEPIITMLTNEYFFYRRRTRQMEAPRPRPGAFFTGLGLQEVKPEGGASEGSVEAIEKAFIAWITRLQTECESLYLKLHMTDLHLLLSPAELGLGVFSYLTKTEYGLEDIDKFLLVLQAPEVRREPDAFFANLMTIRNAIHNFADQERHYDLNAEAPKIQALMRKLKKGTAQMKKRLQGALPTPKAKKSKVT